MASLMNRHLLFALAFVFSTSFAMAENDNWTLWRGPNQDGIAASNQKVPLNWSEKDNVKWKVKVTGRGHGSPTVFNQYVYLATADEKQNTQHVICYRRTDGDIVWNKEIHRGKLNFKNKKASQASCSIACDGERLFVNFLHDSRVELTCLSLKGDILWQKKVSDYVVHQGYGSSPTIHESLVLVSADNKKGGAIVAFNRATGDEVWRQSRPKTPNYPSPRVVKTSGKQQLLMSGCNLVSGFEPLTGKKLWEAEGSTTECVTTAVVHEDLVFTSGGYPRNHVAAVKTDGSGEIVWNDPTRVYVPSMIVEDGSLYAIADAGFLVCWRCDDGEVMWKKRLQGNFTSSLVKWKDYLFATNENGITFVVKADYEGAEVVSDNQLGNDAYATPAICGSQIFLRHGSDEGSDRQEYLYCIGE